MKPILLALTLALATAPALPAFADPDPNVADTITQAQKEMDNGQYEQAMDDLQDLGDSIQDDGQRQQVTKLLADAKQKACAKYVASGQKLLADKKYNDALSEFESALDIVSDDAAATKGKKAAENGPHAEEYVKAAKENMAKGKVDYAIAYFQKAYDLTEDPEIARMLAEAKAKKAKH